MDLFVVLVVVIALIVVKVFNMIDMDKVTQFLEVENQTGYGHGDCNGSGHGYGFGSGYDDGLGDGSGRGAGYGRSYCSGDSYDCF